MYFYYVVDCGYASLNDLLRAEAETGSRLVTVVVGSNKPLKTIWESETITAPIPVAPSDQETLAFVEPFVDDGFCYCKEPSPMMRAQLGQFRRCGNCGREIVHRAKL